MVEFLDLAAAPPDAPPLELEHEANARDVEAELARTRERPTIRGSLDVWKPPAFALGTLAPWRLSWDDGSKFPGGWGFTELLYPDYWTLRKRSRQLFEQNHYARGLIRRLVTNEINTGLSLTAMPEETLLGFQEDELAEWTEETENRFALWCDNPELCDQTERLTFGEIQALARTEALVTGDVLVTLRQDPRTGQPRVQLICGEVVQSPSLQTEYQGNTIKYGVEIDSTGRHVAYWIRQDDGTAKRLPAWGEKSGRRLAWLVYGTDKRLDDVRGKPLLALVLQSLKEIDRYRDSTQRKALVLSMLALYIKKGSDQPGTRPLTNAAVRAGREQPNSSVPGRERSFRTAEQIPGLVVEELQKDEEPTAFKTDGTVESFGVFEEAIIQSIAWANEIPPEILTLSFNSNYSASQAAINEFKMYLNKVRSSFGAAFCQPIYTEWLLAEVLAARIEARELVDAWRDPAKHVTFAAWISADWAGQIKPAVDLSKLVAGYDAMVAAGYIDRERATRELTGTNFRKNAKRLLRQNELVARFQQPILALQQPKAPSGNDAGKQDARGEGEDGKEDKIEGMTNYPRRRALALATSGRA